MLNLNLLNQQPSTRIYRLTKDYWNQTLPSPHPPFLQHHMPDQNILFLWTILNVKNMQIFNNQLEFIDSKTLEHLAYMMIFIILIKSS